MQVIRTLILIGAMFLALRVQAEPLVGAEAATNSAPTRRAFEAEVRPEGGPGLLPVNRAYLMIGTNRFAFLVPAGFRPIISEQQQVKLFTADFSSLLMVQVLEEGRPEFKPLNAETGREIVLQRFPGAQILDQSVPTVCGRAGLGYNIEWIAAGSLLQRAQIVLVETCAGVLELSLSSSIERFGVAQRGFNTLLLTLVGNDDSGVLKVAPVSSLL